MTNLTATPGWDQVPQLEITDVIMAGPGGLANAQAQALVDRTEWLRGLSVSATDPRFAGGAKLDGSSCVAAIQAAMDYVSAKGGGDIWLPDGLYRLDEASLKSDPSPTASAFRYWFKVPSNVTLRGGRGAVFRVDDNVVQGDATKQYCKGFQIFWAWSVGTVSNFAVRGITIDCNGANNLAPAKNSYGSGVQTHVMVTNCGVNWQMDDVTVVGTSGYQCVAFYMGATRLKVTNCTFLDMAGSITGNTNLSDHSTIYCEADTYLFAQNRFINTNYDTVATCIETHGFDGIVANNYGKRYNLGMLRAAMLGDSYNVLNFGNVFDDVTVGVQFDAGAGRKLNATIKDNKFRFRPYAQRGTRTMNAVNTGGGFVGRTAANSSRILVEGNVFTADPTATAAGVNFCIGGNVDYLELKGNETVGFTQYYAAGNFVDNSTVVIDAGYVEGASGNLIKHESYVAGAAAARVNYRISSPDLSKSPGLAYFISCAFDNANICNVSITGTYSIAIQPYTGYYNVIGNYFQVDYTTTSMGSKNCAPFITGRIYDITHRAMFFRDNVADPQRWRIRRQGTAAPTTAFAVGDDHVGDIVENSAPAAGGVMGWVCTAQSSSAGVLGTFKSYGAIAA